MFADNTTADYVGAPVVEAEPAAETAIETEISVASERYLTLGDGAFREGRYTDAVQLYAKAVELSPTEGALFLVLADALFAAGDYHYAAYAIRRSLELDPTLVDSPIDKHDFYDDPRAFDRQLATLETYLVDHPTDRDARLVLSLNCLFGGRITTAIDLLESPAAASLAEDEAAILILETALRSLAADTDRLQPVRDR